MSGTNSVPTLEVRNLRTHFYTPAGVLPAVDDVSLTLERGRILGLVGDRLRDVMNPRWQK